MKEDIELVVVGAGPAGIEAAVTAANAGVEVALIDTSAKPGGQYFIQVPGQFQCDDRSKHQVQAQELFDRLAASSVQVYQNTLVWGIFEGAQEGTWCLTLFGAGAPFRLNAQAVILASGAYDRTVPFPGWDIPGVITTGAALRMIKHQRLLPGKRVILSGSGPLQLSAAAHLAQAGAEVVEVLESATRILWRGIPHLPALWAQWGRMGEGLGYLRTIVRQRIPYRTGRAVIAVEGEDRVCRAVTARLDSSGKPIPRSEVTRDVDTVIIGYNLTPGSELCRVLDCEMAYVHWRGGYVPRRSEEMETSRPGIYAVGDGAGIGGAEMSMIEGRIAARSAAQKLGHTPALAPTHAISRERRALRREQRFARLLGELFSPPQGMYTLADKDTIICRCEQVTLGQIREAISYGAQTVSDIKNIVRTGMGYCQGRTCGSTIASILAAETGRTLEDVRYLNLRPPVHPVPLEVVEEYESKANHPGIGEPG